MNKTKEIMLALNLSKESFKSKNIIQSKFSLELAFIKNRDNLLKWREIMLSAQLHMNRLNLPLNEVFSFY